jgi:hypothetical protein
MAKRSEPPKPIVWNVYKLASKAVWLGVIEAPDEEAAMEKGAAEFKVPAKRAEGVEVMTPSGSYRKMASLPEPSSLHIVA